MTLASFSELLAWPFLARVDGKAELTLGLSTVFWRAANVLYAKYYDFKYF